jgi:hypothetical protein
MAGDYLKTFAPVATHAPVITDFCNKFGQLQTFGQFHLTGSDRYPWFRVSNFAQSPSIER